MKPIVTLAAAAAMTFAAQASPVTPSEAEDVLEAYGATLQGTSVASETAHTIDAEIDGVNITVRLGNCDDTDQCGYVMFFSTFDLGDTATDETLARTNAYNDSYPFGRAFVIPAQEGGSDVVGIDYVIDLSGEAEMNTEDVSRFQEVLSSYITHWTNTQ